MAYALAASIAWLVSALLAHRSQGFWPPLSANAFLMTGWVPLLLAGLGINMLRSSSARWSLGVLLVAFAAVAPPLATRYLPGVKRLEEFSIPGHPTFALSARPTGNAELWLYRGDADHVVRLTHTSWGEYNASLSPDGRHVVYTSNQAGSYDLYVMDLDASGHPVGGHRLTSGPNDEIEPWWSPDGSKILFEQRTEGSYSDVVVMNADGTNQMRLTSDGRSWDPSWSPDGTQIVYSSSTADDPGNYDIWTMRADGTQRRQLLDAGGDEYRPYWSPDGTKILFTSNASGSQDVFIANADGSGVRNLTPGSPDTDFTVGWTADSRYALFASDRSHSGGTFLYFMNLDGSDVKLALII